MSNLIKLVDYRGRDPILRKGDLVKLVDILFDPEEVDWDLDLAESCYGYAGMVTEVKQRYGEDSEAPGQAMWFSVAFPFEDGWQVLEEVPLAAICRIIAVEELSEAVNE